MEQTPFQRALSDADLPSVEVGGGAFSKLVPPAFGRRTADEDLALTLPRGEQPAARFETALRALSPLGLREERLLRLAGPRYWFMMFHGAGKLDLFVDGVADWDFRPGGSGCVYFVDDEPGPVISASGLLICKLVANRPTGEDRLDAASLMVEPGIAPAEVAAKARKNLAGPAGPRRLTGALTTIINLFVDDRYVPDRDVLTSEQTRQLIVSHATQVRDALVDLRPNAFPRESST